MGTFWDVQILQIPNVSGSTLQLGGTGPKPIISSTQRRALSMHTIEIRIIEDYLQPSFSLRFKLSRLSAKRRNWLSPISWYSSNTGSRISGFWNCTTLDELLLHPKYVDNWVEIQTTFSNFWRNQNSYSHSKLITYMRNFQIATIFHFHPNELQFSTIFAGNSHF